MTDFECAVNNLLRIEGGVSENPNDNGGITNGGISLRFLRSIDQKDLREYGINEEPNEETIRNLSIDQMKIIYQNEFWNHAPFNQIMNQEFGNYIFQMSVNMGISPMTKCVQRACWGVLKKWQLLPDDGIMGSNTIAAINQCGFMLMPALRAECANHYRIIVMKDPTQQHFFNGWLNRAYGINQ
jgi:lysozyme family protein